MSLNLVQYNFNHAANTYLAHATLQKHCAEKILALLQKYHSSGWLLDLGSGPGTLLHQANVQAQSAICYDISLPMLARAKQYGAGLLINGDASFLPFADNSIQTVISNLMLQWPVNKEAIFAEIKRVLVPNGHVIFTTLIEPSLWQLQQAWATIDDAQHTLPFLSADYYQVLCKAAGFKCIDMKQWHYEMHFADIKALLRHFKATGTSMPKSANSQGLGGKKNLALLASAYPGATLKTELELSYYPLLLIVKKE